MKLTITKSVLLAISLYALPTFAYAKTAKGVGEIGSANNGIHMVNINGLSLPVSDPSNIATREEVIAETKSCVQAGDPEKCEHPSIFVKQNFSDFKGSQYFREICGTAEEKSASGQTLRICLAGTFTKNYSVGNRVLLIREGKGAIQKFEIKLEKNHTHSLFSTMKEFKDSTDLFVVDRQGNTSGVTNFKKSAFDELSLLVGEVQGYKFKAWMR